LCHASLNYDRGSGWGVGGIASLLQATIHLVGILRALWPPQLPEVAAHTVARNRHTSADPLCYNDDMCKHVIAGAALGALLFGGLGGIAASIYVVAIHYDDPWVIGMLLLFLTLIPSSIAGGLIGALVGYVYHGEWLWKIWLGLDSRLIHWLQKRNRD
jgi:predicted PurR-regulated permease PerM